VALDTNTPVIVSTGEVNCFDRMAEGQNQMGKLKNYKTSIDLPAEVREQITTLLNQHLADTFDLYSQAKQAHWNVKGAQFFQLHELFDKLADEAQEYVDLIAERVTALGGTAAGTVRMSAAASRLDEYPLDVSSGLSSVEALVSAYGSLAQTTREAIETSERAGDADTADLFTEVSRGLDKSLWFLEAHLQSSEASSE
jgi:starvation-inducible DNA-binding protein